MSSIEEQVCFKILKRSDVGKKKYGTTMEREDLSKLDWLKHAQEEAMDLAVYLQKLIELEESKPFQYEWNMTKPIDSGNHNRKMLDLEIENLGKEKED
tara:strand:- start:6779 stop:7072 length:294 start_codon:yes stop_codon:yes gene_type:complete